MLSAWALQLVWLTVLLHILYIHTYFGILFWWIHLWQQTFSWKHQKEVGLCSPSENTEYECSLMNLIWSTMVVESRCAATHESFWHSLTAWKASSLKITCYTPSLNSLHRGDDAPTAAVSVQGFRLLIRGHVLLYAASRSEGPLAWISAHV